MEKITYRDQVIWGTSLNMADEDEIELCYKYIKESIDRRKDLYNICSDAVSANSFINSVDSRWQCGNNVTNLTMCDKVESIEKEELINLIDGMISDDINVNFEEIFKIFKNRGYIDVYRCDRVFFLKDV